MKYNQIDGNLFVLAAEGNFDVIAHGCNCFCTMGAGIAVEMARIYKCNAFSKENNYYKGDINKLGNIEYMYLSYDGKKMEKEFSDSTPLAVVNCYTQYRFGKNVEKAQSPFNYCALSMCLEKMNYLFKGLHIGLPRIGAGLAGGDWELIEEIIKDNLIDCNVTIVNYKKEITEAQRESIALDNVNM